MEGVIVKSTGTFYLVKAGEKMITARIRGKFRLKNHRLTNPIAVGDVVELSEEEDIEGIRVMVE